ncbi:hypothetical protein ES708_35051 [subsurface metagenome]
MVSASSFIVTPFPLPRLIGTQGGAFSSTTSIQSASSSEKMKSLTVDPSPHTLTGFSPSIILLISAGITCAVAGSKSSKGPYTFDGLTILTASHPYSRKYASP